VLDAARLYAITPDAEPDAVVGLVGAVLRGGADVVQLRHKTLARGALLDLAGRLAAMVHDAGRLFIVNDHLDIALIAGADGVHRPAGRRRTIERQPAGVEPAAYAASRQDDRDRTVVSRLRGEQILEAYLAPTAEVGLAYLEQVGEADEIRQQLAV